MPNRVPEVTLAFWVIKIMSTTVGETGADYLAVHVGLGTAVTAGIMITLLVAALLLQLRMQRYVPWIYWLTVVLASVVGTQITDALTDGLEISLYISTAPFAAALAATFAVWYIMLMINACRLGGLDKGHSKIRSSYIVPIWIGTIPSGSTQLCMSGLRGIASFAEYKFLRWLGSN
jgi:Repeat of Unknown Function (DUF347)